MERKHTNKTINVLNDSPTKLVFKTCLPLVIASVISIFTSSITNVFYGKYGGEFLKVSGLLGVITFSFSSVISAFVLSAWMKTAKYYQENKVVEDKGFLSNAIYAVILFNVLLVLALLLMQKQIFYFTETDI